MIGLAPRAIVTAVRLRSRHGESLRDLVKDEIRQVFDAVDMPVPDGQHPHVTLIVGVNGTGKTTTVGKLANLLKASGKEPLVCAADTFRAAASNNWRSGRSAPTSTSSAPRKAPTRRRSSSTRFSPERRAAAIRSSWTPPGALHTRVKPE